MTGGILIAIIILNIMLVFVLFLLNEILREIKFGREENYTQFTKDFRNTRLEINDRSNELLVELKEIHRLQEGITQCAWKIERKIK